VHHEVVQAQRLFELPVQLYVVLNSTEVIASKQLVSFDKLRAAIAGVRTTIAGQAGTTVEAAPKSAH